ERGRATPARETCVFCIMCTSASVTYVNEPTKCRELVEVPDEHSVRQPRYPALARDRKLCAPALLPVCPGRTTVHMMDFMHIHDTLARSEHGKDSFIRDRSQLCQQRLF